MIFLFQLSLAIGFLSMPHALIFGAGGGARYHSYTRVKKQNVCRSVAAVSYEPVDCAWAALSLREQEDPVDRPHKANLHQINYQAGIIIAELRGKTLHR